ncbi:hypothetical protein PY257_06820 [Ramlibacter sp. H39-3-26]|uniref:choice-of-anchor U domain-containing protein n=1 Tax=Curvibacter soli TaxID=3031331 RepID=UPI0023D9C945|nr:choice-of-anchor U domain-containing protein [Ramlibacter sp. H39-3-26]MDF1484900.1 hypothetical protein [Ramlibacter sp. H39-3-26]
MSDITVTIDGTLTRTIYYAASANPATGTTPRWHTGRSDGSTVIDGSTRLVADDEAPALDASGNAAQSGGGNAFSAYAPGTSGLPLKALPVDSGLNLSNPALQTDAACTTAGFTGIEPGNCKSDGEMDMEASFPSGGAVYVTGSHSNNKNGHSRPDRWRFFKLTPGGSGAGTTLTLGGYYQWLREDIRTWDAGNADYFGLVASSNGGAGQQPENPNLAGFSIEGATTSPTDSAAWFGFRAPLVTAPGQGAVTAGSATGRTHALIVPVTNFTTLGTAAGGTKGTATFGAPIRLDLGGRGIREIRKNAANQYLIIAGPPDSATGTAPKDFRLYSWDGSVNAAGLAVNLRLRSNANLAADTRCAPEGIGDLPTSLDASGSVEVISDCGDADFYANGTAAKDLTYAAWKKTRADSVALAALPTVALYAGTPTTTTLPFTATPSAAGTLYAVVLPAAAAAPSWEQVVAGTDSTGAAAIWKNTPSVVGATATNLTATGLTPSTGYKVHAVVVTTAGGYASTLGTLSGTTDTPLPQTITFNPLLDQTLGAAPFTVSATGGGSGNPVVFTSTTAVVCRADGTNGSTVTLLAAGICILQANLAGNVNFAPATPVSQSFTVSAPTASGTTFAGNGSSVSSAGVAGGAWQFASNSPGFGAATGLPGLPAGYTFPYGMFSFVLVNGTPGTSATVSLSLAQPAPANAVLWKYGRQAVGGAKVWYQLTPTFSGDRKTVSFTVTDGPGAATGDDDQVANSVIIDPVGLGLGGGATPIPTLGEWARGLLALTLAGLAMLRLRARQRG